MKRNTLSITAAVVAWGMVHSQSLRAQEETLEELIVTGSPVARSAFDTPLSVVSFNEDDIVRLSASSNADLLRNVPGISVEGGGGEVAVNLRVRGLPSAGQYSFTPLNFDGFSAFSYFGLNSSAFDVYHRADLGIERVEFVKGGVSNLFGPGSVAGIVNYISRRGADDARSKIQLEVAEEGRLATNFATSGPFGAADGNNYYALSGYYRYDEGPIDTGLETEGYQLKGNFMHEFDDGSGAFTLFAQAIDDGVQFYLPLPLDADTQEFATGNDGSDVTTIQTDEVDGFRYPTASGFRTMEIGDGVTTRGGSLGLELNKEYGSGWSVLAKAKYAKYDHNFAIFIPAGGGSVQTTEAFLVDQGLDGFQSATFTIIESGEALNADDLVYQSQAWDRDRPATDFTSEFNLTKSFDSAGITHNLTTGVWFSRASADDVNDRIQYLGEFNDQPHFLSLVVSGDDAATAEVESGDRYYSYNGFAGSGGHLNTTGAANRVAIYLADQIEAERWNWDFGARIERFEGEFSSEGAMDVPMPDNVYPPTIVTLPNLQSDTVGNGLFTRAQVSDTAYALATAFLWRLSDSINLYGNASRGFFWPQLRGLPGQINSVGDIEDPRGTIEDNYEAETVNQAEIGFKFNSDLVDGSLGAFWVTLKDRVFVEQREVSPNVFELQSTLQETRAFGIEANGRFSLGDFIRLDANFTWTDHEFTDGDTEGNELARQPDILAGLGLVFDNDIVDVGLTYSYRGDTFADDDNTVELDAFNILRFDAGYTLNLDSDEQLRFSLAIFNLTDDTGLTEGNPRAGGLSGGDFQVGRPILPRRVSLRLSYDF